MTSVRHQRSSAPAWSWAFGGSAPSHRGLEWGAFIAPTLGTRVEAVIAWQLPASYGFVVAEWDREAETTVVLRDSIPAVVSADPPLPIHTSVQEGGAAHVILESAKGAQLLMARSRGHGWLRRVPQCRRNLQAAGS